MPATQTLALSDIADPEGQIMAVHGSAVAFEGKGVLFFGKSGTGKSSTALAMMALGAVLVSDDRVNLAQGPLLQTPPNAPSLIEARGVGLLRAQLHAGPVSLALAVAMDRPEPERLPPSRWLDCWGAKIPLLLAQGHPNVAPVLVQYLRSGRQET